MPELAFTLHDITGVHAHPNALSSLTKHLRKCTRFGREDGHRAGNAWSWTRRSGRRDTNLHRGAHRRGHDRTLDRSRPRSIRPRSISAKALSRSLSDPSRRIPSCQTKSKTAPPTRPKIIDPSGQIGTRQIFRGFSRTSRPLPHSGRELLGPLCRHTRQIFI